MNILRNRLFILSISLFLFSSAFALPSQKNEGLKNLHSNWELFLTKSPQQTFSLIDNNQPADFTVNIPHEWNKEAAYLGLKSAETYGCYVYHCENLEPKTKYAIHSKESPGTSCAIYINRVLQTQTGNPFAMLDREPGYNSKGYNRSYSQSIPIYCEFMPDKNGNAEIVVFVSNYYYRKGGMWDSVYLGKAETIWHYNILTMVFYSIVIGSLLFTALLNMVQFATNKKRKAYYYLGLASFAFALRISTAGYCSLGILFPNLTAELKVKLEMVAMWLVPVAVTQLIYLLYPSNERSVVFKFIKEKYIRYTLISIALFTGFISLILPAWYANRLVPFTQLLLIVFSVYVITSCIINLVKRKRYSLYNFLSFSTIAAGGIIDIIHNTSKESIPIPTLPFFILAFVIVQIVMLAAIQNDIYKETVKGSNDLQKLNEAYLRFVPKEFLKLLNKDSIIKTKLGDYSNIEMTIMFSKVDISCADADFSLDAHFTIFNEYLKIVSPVIKKYDGFVSKFLSGGFMALFPKSELDALRASLEIKENIKRFNESENQKNYTITPWMGIHFGKMIIGTIGEENRLDDTVISDTVNTVARIESVCERIKKNIIISEAVQKRIEGERYSNLQINALDVIYVKGKEKPLQLYEINRKKKTGSTREEE